jgi:CO/xanthine dehydrogenase Mo-binding subunit
VAKYGIDCVVPDMLHAKFLRSPYANARIKSLDITKAKAIPGVVDIVTWEDEDIKNLGGGGGGFVMGPSQGFLSNLADQDGAEVGVIVVAENEKDRNHWLPFWLQSLHWTWDVTLSVPSLDF